MDAKVVTQKFSDLDGLFFIHKYKFWSQCVISNCSFIKKSVLDHGKMLSSYKEMSILSHLECGFLNALKPCTNIFNVKVSRLLTRGCQS